jgi:nucleoside-specific outer membrane channel protein Tsx
MALPDGTELEWRLDALDGAIVLNFTKDNGIAITNADAGTVKITITPVQSDIAPGVYQDAFRVTLPDGSKSTQWTGSITVKPSLFVLG